VIYYDVNSVKQMTAKPSTPKGGVTHTSLPFFPVNLARNQTDPEMFKLITLCNITIGE
jgi:hypothetical protein